MSDPNAPTPAEQLARMFHDANERLAPSFGYDWTLGPWDRIEERNRKLMIAVCDEIVVALLEGRIIEYPDPGAKIAILLGKTEDGKIRVDFQKPLKWFAFDKDHAINFALTILQHCGVPVNITLNPPPANADQPA